jgi:hypothetical protein
LRDAFKGILGFSPLFQSLRTLGRFRCALDENCTAIEAYEERLPKVVVRAVVLKEGNGPIFFTFLQVYGVRWPEHYPGLS